MTTTASGIEILDLTQLADTQVTQSLAQTTEMIQEAFPNIDVMRGVFHDLLLYADALLATQIRAGAIDRYLSARSLMDIEADPSLADPDFTAAVLSNYRITPGAGQTATGEITIVLTQDTSVTIANGAVFTANGNIYTSDAAYTAKTEAAQINGPTDQLITQLADGNFAFSIFVTATVIGTAANLPIGTLIVPETLPNNYLTSYAAGSFTGGLDAQTVAELIPLMQTGIACQAPSNRTNMEAMLLAQPAFANVVNGSIVGAGDPEMLRDQHTIWPGSLGGRADWYIRTVQQLVQTTLSVTATLQSINVGGTQGTWQFAIGKDTAPGFYEVVSVLLPTAQGVTGSFPITADMRGLDLSGSGFIPDIVTVAEGAYSRFQTTAIQFTDDQTNYTALAVGAIATYAAVVSMLPQIDAIQDFVSGGAVRSYGADVLVKAPIPCFVSIYFRIAKNHTQADPDIADIQTAVALAVSTQGFTGRLYAAMLQDIVSGYLTPGMSVGAIDMLGRIRSPNGSMKYIRSNEVLVVPSLDAVMVSARTVQFFVAPADVNVAISTEIPVTH